uniref:Uncharacterized protein n=1 Tax=Cacopsylla melanoneura TaxID=428564 RepID=A0A8D8R0R0_9HEMI
MSSGCISIHFCPFSPRGVCSLHAKSHGNNKANNEKLYATFLKNLLKFRGFVKKNGNIYNAITIAQGKYTCDTNGEKHFMLRIFWRSMFYCLIYNSYYISVPDNPTNTYGSRKLRKSNAGTQLYGTLKIRSVCFLDKALQCNFLYVQCWNL